MSLTDTPNRLATTFADLKKSGAKALVTFLTAGDPDAQKSLSVLAAMPQAGADIIEIGIPFSDPMADGPTIQDSSLRALQNGMSVQGVLQMVQQFRQKNTTTPIVLMGYFNPIYKYGCERFIHDAAQAGIDGLIVVDLPPEEDAELCTPARMAGIDLIRLVTPTTNAARLEKILTGAGGFLYYVSITGVTGTKSADITAVGNHIAEIKTMTDLPVVAGFGIRTPDDAAKMAGIADGVVVGSAIVENIHDHHAQPDQQIVQTITTQIRALKTAI